MLFLVACALQVLRHSGTHGSVPDNIEDLSKNFSFNEVRKRSLQTPFCSVLCDTVSDNDTLLNCGGLILPMGQITLFLTFAPTADDTIRTSLPKEIRLAFRSHKALFYQGGLMLTVTSSILAPPSYIFQMALITLLSINQTDKAPTPTEGPRQVFDVIANVTPMGQTPRLPRLFFTIKEDTADGAKPLP
jgi:hypothetical protein